MQRLTNHFHLSESVIPHKPPVPPEGIRSARHSPSGLILYQRIDCDVTHNLKTRPRVQAQVFTIARLDHLGLERSWYFPQLQLTFSCHYDRPFSHTAKPFVK